MEKKKYPDLILSDGSQWDIVEQKYEVLPSLWQRITKIIWGE